MAADQASHARRRLEFQKSYSLERKGSWRRRSLIDDARFDSEINAELSKEDEQTLQLASNAADDVAVVNDVFSVSNGAAPRTCAIVLAARDAATLSRIFKVFENCRTVVQHIESRTPRGDDNPLSSERHHCHHPHHLELLIKFEGQSDDVSSTVKSLKQLSAVDELTVVSERMPISKGTTTPRYSVGSLGFSGEWWIRCDQTVRNVTTANQLRLSV